MRGATARALSQLAASRPADGSADGVPFWVVPWPLVRDALILLPAPPRAFLSQTVRPADWSALVHDALARRATGARPPAS